MPCQRFGSAWQKACSVRSGRLTKRSVTEKITPEVPSETKPCARPRSRRRRWRRPRCRRRRRRSGFFGPRGPRPWRRRARDAPRPPSPRRAAAWRRASSPVAASRRSSQRRFADVEPRRARGVGHFGHRLAREAQAHVVLGQQHALRRLGDLGLVRGDPQHLRRGEAGHHEIAGDLFDVGNAALELRAFGERAAVVPQDRRPERLVVPRRAGSRHASGPERPIPASARERLGRLLADRGDRRLDAAHPVVRVLLAPQGVRARDAERGRGLGDDPLVRVDQQRLHRRRADVEPEIGLLRAFGHRRLPPFMRANSISQSPGPVAGRGAASRLSHPRARPRARSARRPRNTPRAAPAATGASGVVTGSGRSFSAMRPRTWSASMRPNTVPVPMPRPL